MFFYLYSHVQSCILRIIKENYVAKLKLMKRKARGFYFPIPFYLKKNPVYKLNNFE